MSKVVDFSVENNELSVGVDPNRDGQKVVSLKISLNEAFQEALKRGAPVEGKKAVSVGFKGTTLVIEVDTDRDGERLLSVEADLSEVVDEIQG